MKTQTHIKYAVKLCERYFPSATFFEKQKFILGCIMPDLHPFSYLRGFKIRPFFGHNWENAKGFILSRTKEIGHQGHYGLGLLLHYLCDAFTHPHNSGFSGGVRQHNIYEKRLHDFVLQSSSHENNAFESNGTLSEFILKKHEQYMMSSASYTNDARFISLISEQVILAYRAAHNVRSEVASSGIRFAERYISRP